MSTEPSDVDDGRNSTPLLRAAAAWCFGAGVMLLLPRQWVSAGIVFTLALVFWWLDRRKRKRDAAMQPAEPRADAAPDPSDPTSAG